jgi:hypothetical protein
VKVLGTFCLLEIEAERQTGFPKTSIWSTAPRPAARHVSCGSCNQLCLIIILILCRKLYGSSSLTSPWRHTRNKSFRLLSGNIQYYRQLRQRCVAQETLIRGTKPVLILLSQVGHQSRPGKSSVIQGNNILCFFSA